MDHEADGARSADALKAELDYLRQRLEFRLKQEFPELALIAIVTLGFCVFALWESAIGGMSANAAVSMIIMALLIGGPFFVLVRLWGLESVVACFTPWIDQKDELAETRRRIVECEARLAARTRFETCNVPKAPHS